MKEIKLANNKGIALVDDQDHELLSKYKWHLAPTGKVKYARTIINHKQVLMHRLVLEIPNGKDTDHINRNGLDNRRSNLRVASRAENNANRGVLSKKYGVRGVSYDPRYNKKWQARIKLKGKVVSLGMHNTKEEAGKAYDKKAKELYGEYAVVNYPNNSEVLGEK